MATSATPDLDRRRSPAWPLILGALLLVACGSLRAGAEEPNPFAPDRPAGGDELVADADTSESGVLLPADRGKDRLLDRARRLVADGRWTDATAVLDELIADASDAFAGEDGTPVTRRSVRSEAARMIEALPRPGQEAYGLLFRARAEKALAEAVAADDGRAIRAVARRWFATPAGRSAALMAAIDALESNQPHEAAAWLDRLATSAAARELEPTLSLMRALARQRAGEGDAAAELLEALRDGRAGTARIAGRDVVVSFAGGEALAWLARCLGSAAERAPAGWRQPRGDAARNALATATRPLLVPRYRVPLARHPQEARLLEKRRQAAADAGQPLLPAGTPLALGDTIVLHTGMGILGVDFTTGKRLWLQSAVTAADDAGRTPDGLDAALGRTFDDATSAGLSSDGRFVFAVESHPDALSPRSAFGVQFDLRGLPRSDGGWRGGNTLSAYDTTARGAVRWRLPAAAVDGAAAAASWYLGAPLVVGAELYTLVETAGEVRLDVIDARQGTVLWSQPLAALDERRTADQPAAVGRRRSGLTPAYAEGVLVCPLGAGTVVALDIATRSLLWAHHYPHDDPPAAEEVPLRDAAADEARRAGGRRADPCPVIAGGRVLLTPDDSAHLICLGLRDGTAAWPPRPGGLRVAGVAAGRVIVVGPQGVEALAADTGNRLWQRPHAPGTRPSGRGILTATSLFLPLDTPEVIEIRLADGGVAARCPARGGAIPGNLLAYRGEILSRGVDTLDVFHQEAALEARIETARREAPDDAWAATWRAHVEVAGGDVAAGLRALYAAGGVQRPARQTLRDAMIHALDRDFAASVVVWRELAARDEPVARAPEVVRMAVDGCLRAGDLPGAWEGCLTLLREPGAADPRLFADPTVPTLEVSADRWLRGRLHELRQRAAGALRDEVDRTIGGLVTTAAAQAAPRERVAGLATLIGRLGRHPAAAAARERLVQAIDDLGADGGRPLALRRELLAGRREAEATPVDDATAWPLGRVVRRGGGPGAESAQSLQEHQPVPLFLAAVERPLFPGLSVAYEQQRRRLLVRDGHGRLVGAPLELEAPGGGMLMPWGRTGTAFEVAVLGSVLVARTANRLTAFDLAADVTPGRPLWRHAAALPDAPERVVGWGGVRAPRGGHVPLGLRISEPNDGGAGQGWLARADGILVHHGAAVMLLDPFTGAAFWERHDLPDAQWVGDDIAVCGCTPQGNGSPVLAADDGRLLHTFDLPPRRQRLAVHGRRVVAVRLLDEEPGAPVAGRVRLELVDPLERRAGTLGEFSGAARATVAEPGRLAVVEPGGELSLFDLETGDLVFRRPLPGMPRRCEELHVRAWQDRYLVFVGAVDGAGDDAGADVAPIEQLIFAGESSPPLSGAVWALAREGGDLLWPVPATIERHCLQASQPAALPVLLFCRHVHSRLDRDRPHVNLLCLDKRTGHAVLEENRLATRRPQPAGCELEGDPAGHSISIREAGAGRPVVLVFTGEPTAPRPPFQARVRPPAAGVGLDLDPDADAGSP